MRKVSLIAACVCGLAVSPAMATEGGGGAYPNGAEDFMSGALPPPGDYLITYGLYYKADELIDGQGNKLPVDFDLDVAGVVLRYVHVTPVEVLGGLWAQHIFVPALNVDVTTPAGSDDKTGLGDLIVDPVILSWHKPPFHWAVGLDTYVPVGAYDKDDLANVGRNYWTFEPVAAATYMDENGIDVSVKLMYDINTENSDTDYRSGDEFHCDYAAGIALGPVKLGATGYYYKQTTDDDAPAGAMVLGKGEQIAAGPAVGCQIGKASVVAKYQREFETEARPEGDRFWLKLVVPF